MANGRVRVKRKYGSLMPMPQGKLWLDANAGEGVRMSEVAEGVGFEPTRERNPLPVFKTGALNHSATLPL
jgi:hypothetical protein